MRARLVSERITAVREAGRERLGGLGLVLFRVCLRAAGLDFDLILVMGSSEVMRRHPPHHLSPAQANHPAGPDPEARLAAPSQPINAPTAPERQSILSNVVARKTRVSAVRIPSAPPTSP
jgi:hypothetical protein